MLLGLIQSSFLISRLELCKLLKRSPGHGRRCTICMKMLGDAEYSAVVVETFVYVVMDSKKLYRLDILKENSAWTSLPDMLEANKNGGSAVHDGFIYISGESGLQRYDILRNKWTKFHCEGVNFYQIALVECGGSIYSIGGLANNAATNIVNRFSPTSSSWSRVSNMKVDRQTPAVVAHDDMIYVAGGYDDIDGISFSDVECYNLNSGTWATLPRMNKRRDEFGLFYLNGKLFAVGDTVKPYCMEMYDFGLKEWEIIAKMPEMVINARATMTAPLLW